VVRQVSLTELAMLMSSDHDGETAQLSQLAMFHSVTSRNPNRESARMPRNVSVESFLCSETDDVPELPRAIGESQHEARPLRAQLRWRRGVGNKEDDEGESGSEHCDSEYSAARTQELCHSHSTSFDGADGLHKARAAPRISHDLDGFIS